jgi:hypothetical protein
MRLMQFLTLVSLAFGVVACNKPKAKPTAEEKVKAEVTVTTDQLLDDYKNNHIGADQKYKGKWVQVTGKYAGTGNVALFGDYVGLGSSHEGEFDVMCFLDKEDAAARDKAAKLKEGDTVTLLGMCEGKVLGFTAVRLKLCGFPN